MPPTAAPQSMTGYATGSQDTPLGRVTVEIKSVNSRFLDLSFRIPDDLRGAEGPLRELVSGRVRRGKVECRVSLLRASESARLGDPDAALLAELARASRAVRQALPDAPAFTVAEALRWPGVLREDADAVQTAGDAVLPLATQVLDDFHATRSREGARTVDVVLAAVDRVQAIVDALTGKLPQLLAAQQQRLERRLSEALAGAGSTLAPEETGARIRQEITAHGLRADVAEEIARFGTHVTEVRRALRAGGPVGKRLDFLAQELNREANTLGSKAVAVELTNASIELKLLVEQVREQAQNLE